MPRNGFAKELPQNGQPTNGMSNNDMPKNGTSKNGLPESGVDKPLPEIGVDKSLAENGKKEKSLALQTSGVSVSGRYKFQRSRVFTGETMLR